MFLHRKELIQPVNVGTSDARFGTYVLEQFGGATGELTAALQYWVQSFHVEKGEVIETGSAHNKFRKGDRIVVPFNINCGECRQCKLGNYSVCQRSNRNAAMAAEQFGYSTAGLFGYSHLTGGYAGGQAEYVRVPMADVAPMPEAAALLNQTLQEETKAERLLTQIGASKADKTAAAKMAA